MAPSVLLIGASGALGRPLVEEFQRQRARFGRVAILSDPAKVDKFKEVQKNGIEVISGSFLDFKCYQGFDVVISLTGNGAMRLQPAMIEAAIAGGVRHFYPSEFGTDIEHKNFWQFRYFRDKVATRDHLAAKAKEVSDFRYTLMLVGAFSEWAAGEFSGVDLKNHTVVAYGYPDAELSVTGMKDIVRYTVDSILLPFPEGQTRREIRVRGDHLTWTQLIGLLEEIQGVKYQVTFIDPQEAAKKQEEARQRGDEDAELMWAGKTLGPAGRVVIPLPLDNDKFDFKPEPLKEILLRTLKRN
ncbi:NAD(P)-binding protein [Mycena sanguinolenta]|uniref:NAD(P)-binding protein n=1 Tax=Mycena sanguinolenta TaxID=230812 RepID=A0A8H6Z829_9AGAR|nr:NAD(P)-binding protein [Mycena sanguinolenta]